MINIALIIVIFLMLVVAFVFIAKKNISYRIQASSVFNSLVILLITLYSYKINKPEYIDVAILYALLSYVSMIALSKYLVFKIEKQEW